MKKFFAAQLFSAAVVLAGALTAARAAAPITVSVDTSKPGVTIPENFLGVSMEMQYLLPDKDGKYLFSPDNKPLLAMFKTLGIKNLRVGGNTTDNPKYTVPKGKDIDSLYAFAKAADVEVIYTLRLRDTTDPKEAANIAKDIMDHYASQTVCFEVGNEPNVFVKTYPLYKDLFTKFTDAILAEAPTAKFCGPNTTPGKAEWAKSFATDFAKSGRVVMITQHAYPGGNQKKVTDVTVGIDKMLSTGWVTGYQKAYDSFVPIAEQNNLPVRIEEANSYFNGGRQDVSNSHAAALWALDYLYWWAGHKIAGINFHTGDKVAAADESAPCWYALFWTSPKGYVVHPTGYAAKMFSLTAHGTLFPVTLDNSGKVNLTAYAVQNSDKTNYLILINKEHGEKAQPAVITLVAGSSFSFANAQQMSLTSPNNDVTLTSGETLGGSPINDDATWTENWTKPTLTDNALTVPPGTAILLKFSPP